MAKSCNCSPTESASRKDREALRRSGISVDKMLDEINARFLYDLTAAAYVQIPARSRSIKLPSDERSRATADAVTDCTP